MNIIVNKQHNGILLCYTLIFSVKKIFFKKPSLLITGQLDMEVMKNVLI